MSVSIVNQRSQFRAEQEQKKQHAQHFKDAQQAPPVG